MIGRVLAGRYELGAILGQGGMAVVHRGIDRSLGRDVAIKILREQYSSDPEFVERFEREARAAARLSHPNVVDVFDVGTDEGTYFIVMELIDGENLKDLVRRSGPLPPARVIALGREIASALGYAHRRGLVHRDVKPQNVLLDGNGHSRLTDFGIAQAAEQAGLTQTGTVMGTAQYMSPEQASGQPAGPASDLYSLGVVLFELSTGRLPFPGDNSLSIALRHIQEQPTPPRRLNPSIPPALEAVILRAMAKDPTQRFASGAELAQALVEGADPVRERTTAVPAAVTPRRASGVAAPTTREPAARERTAVMPPVVRRPPPPVPRRQSSSGAGGMVVLILLVLASLAFLFLGFNWLFGASRPPSPTATPTPASGPTNQPAIVTSPTATPVTPTATRQTASPTPTPTRPAATATAVPPTATVPPTVPAKPTAPPARVAVPKLVGLGAGEAQARLNSSGLLLQLSEGFDPGQPNGVVLSQTPKEGESVAQGSTVRLVINKRDQATVVVPNVGGQEQNDAKKTLENLGFKVKTDRAQGQKGVVINQSPDPGIRVPAGSEVTIVVGS